MINNIKCRNHVIELIVTSNQKHVNLTYYNYNIIILYNYNSLGSIIMYTNLSALIILLLNLLRKPINHTNTKII